MKGYQFKSAWAFRKGCRNSPLELLNLKETRLPNSNNQIWTDWWFESAGEGQQYSQTCTENIILSDYFGRLIQLIKTETLDINDFIITQLSGGQYYGTLKRWSGIDWMNEPLKIYLSGWQTKSLKRWNGTNWVEINIGG